MAVTNAQVKPMIGMVWDSLDGTTTTIVNSLITIAEDDTKDITGTTTNYDGEIKFRTAALAVNAALGGLGPQSVDDDKLISMRDRFQDEWARKLRQKGFSPDGNVVRFTQVNG